MNPPESLYLDHASTTPVRPEVIEAMAPFWSGEFGNPGSLHCQGRSAKRAVDLAREQVAELLHADPRDIVFTSGGTESNHLALNAGTADPGGQRILVSSVEHPSVLKGVPGLEANAIPVDREGVVMPEELERRLERPNSSTALVSVMWGNNETGVLQPVETIGALCRERGVWFHTDAIQGAGKIDLDVRDLPVDLVSLSAHKLGGPKGVGALYVRRAIALEPRNRGGSQERGRRPGTLNVPGIVGFGVACMLARQELAKESERLAGVRDRMEAIILAAAPGAWVNGGAAPRLPHLLNVGFPGREGEEVMFGLDGEGIAVSTGAACDSGSVTASHVLLAMGQDHARAHSAVRFSLGRGTRDEDADRVGAALAKIL